MHFLHDGNRRIPLTFEGGFAPDLMTRTRVRVRGNLANDGVTATSVEVIATSTATTGSAPARYIDHSLLGKGLIECGLVLRRPSRVLHQPTSPRIDAHGVLGNLENGGVDALPSLPADAP